MKLLENIGQLATCRAEGGQGEIHAIADAALVWEGDTHPLGRAPSASCRRSIAAPSAIDAGGGLVIPGLVDCHTHLAFGGWRAEEFEQRLLGRSYLEIAARGRRHRAHGAAHPRGERRGAGRARATAFLREMLALGVTTVECKSGYGLDREQRAQAAPGLSDRSARSAAGAPGADLPRRPRGAAGVPRRPGGRIWRFSIDDLIPDDRARAAGRVLRRLRGALGVHAWTRRGACSTRGAGGGARRQAPRRPAQRRRRGRARGGGGRRRRRITSSAPRRPGIAAMARAGVVAVSLPLASLYLGQPPAPARRWIEAGVAVAVATDFNPGSAPSYHLPFALTLACTLQRMTPAEALKGATIMRRARGRARGRGSARSSRARRRTSPSSTLPDVDPLAVSSSPQRLPRHGGGGRRPRGPRPDSVWNADRAAVV